MVCLFKKTAVVSVEMVPKNHRQDTAACVSLSRSTISKTVPEDFRPTVQCPAAARGGDLVAPYFRVKRSVPKI
jgi:hypothetical protein